MERGELGSMPEQHEDQLQLGFRMIQNAYNNKMQSLEQEVRGLRLTCEEQKTSGAALQRKNSALEVELVEGHQRSQQLADENKELFKTVNQLRRQLQRLEGLKKSVLDSISDHQQAEIESDDSKLYLRDDYLSHATPLTSAAARGERGESFGPGTGYPGNGAAHAGNRRSTSPPRHASPPRHVSPPPQAREQPMQAHADAGPAVDGKQFFRKARNALSYEAFNDFLANIKLLNNQQQTREETLDRARRIFGPEQQHLYMEFEQLLTRTPA